MTEIEVVEKPRVTVSHSEVESYLRCERQHFYGYGLEIQRQKESDSLARGVMGHAALQVFFTSLKEGEDFETAQQKCYAEVLQNAALEPILVKEIVECLTFFFEGYPFERWQVLAVEQEMILVVDDDLQMPFIVDAVLRDPFGFNWVIDHKFMYDFISDRDIELMPQLPKYFVGMKALGYQVDKMAYSVLRYRSMREPTVDSKYRFTPFDATQRRLLQTISEQVIVSKRIQEAKKQTLEEWSTNAMRTANKMVCNSCSFRSLCVAELNDWQPNLVLNSEYKKKERREFKEIEQG